MTKLVFAGWTIVKPNKLLENNGGTVPKNINTHTYNSSGKLPSFWIKK